MGCSTAENVPPTRTQRAGHWTNTGATETTAAQRGRMVPRNKDVQALCHPSLDARRTYRASTGTTQTPARFQLVTPETTATSKQTMARSEQRNLHSKQRATHRHGARRTLKQHCSHRDDCGFTEDAWCTGTRMFRHCVTHPFEAHRTRRASTGTTDSTVASDKRQGTSPLRGGSIRDSMAVGMGAQVHRDPSNKTACGP